MGIVNLDHIHLKSNNVQEASAWYCKILGGEITYEGKFKGSDVRYVHIGGLNLVIFGELEDEDDVIPASIRSRYGVDHFGFLVTELHEMVKDLKSKGVNIVTDPWTVRSGVHIAYIEGPDSVRIELTQRENN